MIKKIGGAIILIITLPFALINLVKDNKVKSIIILCAILTIISFYFIKKDSPLDIADVSVCFNTGNVRKYTSVEVVALHHTAGNPNHGINEIIDVHYGQNKWHQVGYHYFIDKDGNVFRLRSEKECVPHAFGYNDNAIAICLAGNFSLAEPTEQQWDSALKLVRQVLRTYNLDNSKVFKHNQLKGNNTECCGELFDIEKFKSEL